MNAWTRAAIIAALLGGLSSLPALAEMPGADGNETQVVMKPGQGLPLDVGGKRVVSYYTQEGAVCGLAIVLAQSEMGGMANGGTEGPQGLRVTTQVAPGSQLRIDGDLNRTAEFMCGPDGRKMNAHIYTRAGYLGKQVAH